VFADHSNMHDAYESNKLAALWSALDGAMIDAFDQRSPASVAILFTLKHWAPMTVGELARIVGLSQPACSRALDRLGDGGLVNRALYEGKEARISLTAAGKREAARLQRARLAASNRLLSHLSATERKALSSILDKLLGANVDGRETARRLCRFCAHDVCSDGMCPVGHAATAVDGPFDPSRP
jgi:DNA-binding MarR family transcriptional regulator